MPFFCAFYIFSLHLQVADALAAELTALQAHGSKIEASMARLKGQVNKLEGAQITLAANLADKQAGEQVRPTSSQGACACVL